MGRTIMFKEFNGSSYQLSADEEHLLPGMYFVRILDEKNQLLGQDKIIVQ